METNEPQFTEYTPEVPTTIPTASAGEQGTGKTGKSTAKNTNNTQMSAEQKENVEYYNNLIKSGYREKAELFRKKYKEKYGVDLLLTI